MVYINDMMCILFVYQYIDMMCILFVYHVHNICVPVMPCANFVQILCEFGFLVRNCRKDTAPAWMHSTLTLCGVLGGRTRYVHHGDTSSKILRISSLWLIAMTREALMLPLPRQSTRTYGVRPFRNHRTPRGACTQYQQWSIYCHEAAGTYQGTVPTISYVDFWPLKSEEGRHSFPSRKIRKTWPEGHLPHATKGVDHFRDVFGHMDLTNKAIVALWTLQGVIWIWEWSGRYKEWVYRFTFFWKYNSLEECIGTLIY